MFVHVYVEKCTSMNLTKKNSKSVLLTTSNISHAKSAPATSQQVVLFSHSKLALATSHGQANRVTIELGRVNGY